MSAAEIACDTTKTSYQLCLNSSGRNPQKCGDIEQQLRSCSKSLGINNCIDETVKLLKCTKKPKADVCAQEFVAMRECNRPSGPHILIEDGKYVLHKDVLPEYQQNTVEIGSVNAPVRSTKLLKQTIEGLQSLLQLGNFAEQVVAYKWPSLRSNPGK